MATITPLPLQFERDKRVYEVVDKARSGVVLCKVVSRHSGQTTYEVGHVDIKPASEPDLGGVVIPAAETFVADASFPNEDSARQGLAHKLAKLPVSKPKRSRRKATATA